MGAFDHFFGSEQIVAPIHRLPSDQVPLFYVIGAIWAHFAGWSQFALRYLSLLAGVTMLACLYGFTYYAVNRRTAVIAVFLMATNVFVMIYFHELRAYMFLLLLIIIHLWLYWRLVHRDQYSIYSWMLFALSAAAVMYTHVISFVMLGALGLTHIFSNVALIEQAQCCWGGRSG